MSGAGASAKLGNYPAVETGASVDMSGAGASAKLGNTPLVKLVLSEVTLLMEIPAKVAL